MDNLKPGLLMVRPNDYSLSDILNKLHITLENSFDQEKLLSLMGFSFF